MLSPQEMSDRFEIQDLVYRYAHCIDRKLFDELRDVFSPEAHVDYSAFGGSVGDLESTIDFLKSVLTDELFPNFQHLNANVQIEVNGDHAKGRVMCFNPMQIALSAEESQVYFLGIWYVDEYHREAQGWRITRRSEERSWVFNTPEFMNL
jgi:3-phenylpropionate/cinnamic acid dioxygenase small subunit